MALLKVGQLHFIHPSIQGEVQYLSDNVTQLVFGKLICSRDCLICILLLQPNYSLTTFKELTKHFIKKMHTGSRKRLYTIRLYVLSSQVLGNLLCIK